MKIKKIVHFSLANTKSGITQYILNNWKYIDKTKFRFDMVTFGEKLDFQKDLEADGCRVFYVKNRAEDNLKDFQNEILQIFSNGYDAVHLHTSYWKSFELEKLAKQAGIPKIIVHAHNTAVFDDNGREEKEKQHYKLREELSPDIATDFWACSGLAAEWLYADKIPQEKIHIVNNAIDVQSFKYDWQKRMEVRQRLGWEDKLVIGHVGRFSFQKNHEFLIELLKETAKIEEGVRLMLIGKGPLVNKIRLLVDQYKLADKVFFAGACDDVNCWLQAVDIFALPSRFEGLPIVAIEAQASGAKCLVSNTITKETAVTDNISFLPLDVSAWRDKILADKIETKDRRKYADQVIQAGYDITQYIKTLENMYNSDDEAAEC